MFKLREYQQRAVEKGIEFFSSKSKKNAIIVAPTGSGKSLIIANIAKALNGHTIVFQPSKELLEQNYNKYISYGEKAEIYSASMSQKTIGQVTFATIGSVVNKPELFDKFEYCITDECHLVSPRDSSMYQRFFGKLDLKVLGLTATPIRMKRYNFPVAHAKLCMLDRMRPKFFQEYLHITQISEMVENGYFAEIDYNNFEFDTNALRINSTGADYTDQSIEAALEYNSTLESIEKLFNKLDKSNHILIFVESVKSAYKLQKMIGIDRCGLVESKMNKKEREKVLFAFKSGELKAVVNVGILTIGFDFPELDCIISARPTMSLGLYYQIIGRGVRPHPKKEKLLYFDLVNNYKKFGKIESLNIEKKNGLWVIHNGEYVLTNVDITGEQRDNFTEDKVNSDRSIHFGKFKGQLLSDIPKSYLKWLYETIDRNKYNEYIFEYFEEDKNIAV